MRGKIKTRKAVAQQAGSDETSVCEHNSVDVHRSGGEGTELPGTLLFKAN